MAHRNPAPRRRPRPGRTRPKTTDPAPGVVPGPGFDPGAAGLEHVVIEADALTTLLYACPLTEAEWEHFGPAHMGAFLIDWYLRARLDKRTRLVELTAMLTDPHPDPATGLDRVRLAAARKFTGRILDTIPEQITTHRDRETVRETRGREGDPPPVLPPPTPSPPPAQTGPAGTRGTPDTRLQDASNSPPTRSPRHPDHLPPCW